MTPRQPLQIVQRPNPPIIVAAIAAIPAMLWPDRPVGQIARGISAAALLLWAYLEIIDGANWVRRLMGAVVMLVVLAGIIMWFGGGQ
jgi:hypothetical protein